MTLIFKNILVKNPILYLRLVSWSDIVVIIFVVEILMNRIYLNFHVVIVVINTLFGLFLWVRMNKIIRNLFGVILIVFSWELNNQLLIKIKLKMET